MHITWGEIIPILSNKTEELPYKSRFAKARELRQGGSQSIELEKGKNVQLDYMTFSSVDTRRHTPSENRMHWKNVITRLIITSRDEMK